MSAKLLSMSYSKTPVKQITGTSIQFDKPTARKYSEWATKIYSNKEEWNRFVTTQPDSQMLMYQNKQQYGPFLIPKHSVVKEGKTAVVSIKGTSTAADAVIDLLAQKTTLGNNDYFHRICKTATIINNNINVG